MKKSQVISLLLFGLVIASCIVRNNDSDKEKEIDREYVIGGWELIEETENNKTVVQFRLSPDSTTVITFKDSSNVSGT